MDPFFSSISMAPPPGIPPPSVMPVVAPFVSNPTTATTVAGGPPPSFDHPSYSDMICEAIAALKDNNGSSKRAIAKYIESAHKDLPPTHSALLTHHLKRLKNNGILIMVKKSYKLASTAGSEVPIPDWTPTNPPDPSPGVKRSRGRPPKPKPVIPTTVDPVPQPQPAPTIPQQQPAPMILQQQPAPTIPQQQPTPTISQQQPAPIPQQQSAPIPDVTKRSPGRPRKVNGPVGQLGVRKGRGRPPKTGPMKSPGRPRKPKTVRSVVGVNSMKRGRGRPPKAMNGQLPQPAVIPIQVQPVAVPYADTAAVTATNTAINAASPRPRGRPKRSAVPAAAAAAPPAGVAVTGKGRGRPPKVGGVAAKPITPKKSTGNPVGRPKKNKTTNGAASYGDLQRKLEFFQSKVKQAVEVLRSQFSSENNISMIDAIQELEALAAMDISKPFTENAQPPPEPTQPPPPGMQNEGQVY